MPYSSFTLVSLGNADESEHTGLEVVEKEGIDCQLNSSRVF